MALFYERLPEHLDAKRVLVCHDEFLVECREDRAEEVVNHGLEPDPPHWVPIDVELDKVERWGGG